MNRILVAVKPNRMRFCWRCVVVSSNRTWDVACTLFVAFRLVTGLSAQGIFYARYGRWPGNPGQ
jgi:hypothetical protein